MIDAGDLERSLARLAAPEAPGGAALSLRPFGRRTLLGALLHAIDDTVLPQTLRATNGAGETLLLDAAHRRLMRVRPGAGAALAACDLDADDEGALRRLGEALRAFAHGAALHLAAEPAGGPAAPVARGVSAAHLATLWQEQAAPAAPPSPREVHARLSEAHAGAIEAWIVVDGGEAVGWGEEGARALLEDLAHGPAEGGAVAEGMALALERGGHGLVLVRLDGIVMGFATRPDAADALTAELQQMLLGWA